MEMNPHLNTQMTIKQRRRLERMIRFICDSDEEVGRNIVERKR